MENYFKEFILKIFECTFYFVFLNFFFEVLQVPNLEIKGKLEITFNNRKEILQFLFSYLQRNYESKKNMEELYRGTVDFMSITQKHYEEIIENMRSKENIGINYNLLQIL